MRETQKARGRKYRCVLEGCCVRRGMRHPGLLHAAVEHAMLEEGLGLFRLFATPNTPGTHTSLCWHCGMVSHCPVFYEEPCQDPSPHGVDNGCQAQPHGPFQNFGLPLPSLRGVRRRAGDRACSCLLSPNIRATKYRPLGAFPPTCFSVIFAINTPHIAAVVNPPFTLRHGVSCLEVSGTSVGSGGCIGLH